MNRPRQTSHAAQQPTSQPNSHNYVHPQLTNHQPASNDRHTISYPTACPTLTSHSPTQRSANQSSSSLHGASSRRHTMTGTSNGSSSGSGSSKNGGGGGTTGGWGTATGGGLTAAGGGTGTAGLTRCTRWLHSPVSRLKTHAGCAPCVPAMWRWPLVLLVLKQWPHTLQVNCGLPGARRRRCRLTPSWRLHTVHGRLGSAMLDVQLGEQL